MTKIAEGSAKLKRDKEMGNQANGDTGLKI